MKFSSSFTSLSAATATLLGSASAASYDDIPDIEVYGQHFFYTNNGSQLYAQNLPMDWDRIDNVSATSGVSHTSKTTRLMVLPAPMLATLTHWLMAMLAGGISHT